MELKYKNYTISDDKQRIDVNTVVSFLATSYWGNKRKPEKIKKSLENSTCYGVYDGEKMIAFARVITDWATTYHLSDVFVLEAYRGQGISKKLVEIITNAPEFEWMTGVLGTRDAHTLYEKFGFERDRETYMRRTPRARELKSIKSDTTSKEG